MVRQYDARTAYARTTRTDVEGATPGRMSIRTQVPDARPGNAGPMTSMTASTFQAFGPSHLLVLAIFVAGIWPVVRLGRAQRTTAARRRTSRWFAAGIIAFTVPMQLVDFMPGQYSFSTTLPLQLCDFAWMAAVAALLTHHRFFVALAYFWGLVLTTQGLLTPWLNADFPDPKCIGFWACTS